MDQTARRIGILGGTFDPVHNGHVRKAESLSKFFNFDQMLFIPAYLPPHKASLEITPTYHRYAMTVLATLEMERARVSTIELFARERSYTVNTMTSLRAEYGPQAQLFFMMGADQFATLKTWYQYRTLLDLCHIIVMSRPGYDLGDLATHGVDFGQDRLVDVRGGNHPTIVLDEHLPSGMHIFLTDLDMLDISATEIREALSENRSIADYVPPLVERYIRTYELYT